MAKAGAGDFTGRQKEKLAKQHAAEVAERSKEIALVTQAEEDRKAAEVVDYTKPKAEAPVQDTGPVDLTATPDDEDDETISRIVSEHGGPSPEPESVGADVDVTAERPSYVTEPVTVSRPSRRVRARANLPQVTIGRGNHYDFEEGRTYIVPPNVAAHLEERDLVDVLD